ncbi:uncharacterized protein ACHE_50063A [Aspergillus chevalieri]|uniref:Uncharacterized protein n=1 Tax=Aspergillus chevalieri TaxID=182096 RepID=A0A7R7ZNG5_ASPCH|nr:uncharacterized protein ACHE_50063A [Aspergillus chevalieri]BCR88865.1 hypothetical protein ACHE_50063A [Aspergillus chevalieri]
MAENEVNRIIQARFGDDNGLKIADIIENKPIQADGTLSLNGAGLKTWEYPFKA